MNPSLQNSFHFFFIFFTLFTSKAFSSPIQPISYSDHCNSYAPKAIPTDTMFTRFPVFDTVTTHYTGGQNILDQDPLSQRSILFQATRNLYKTNVVDTYKIQAHLSFFPSAIYYRPDNFIDITYRSPLVFYLDGFWSVSTSKLCMVGSARWFTKQDSVAASMKSLDICSIFRRRFTTYKLEYPSNCKNCSLFGQDDGNLPRFMSLYTIQCSDEDYKLRFLIEFQDRRFTPYDQAFQPEISLIGEGTWNGVKDELCVTACRVLNQSDPLGSARVGDCSIGLTLWFPAARSITKTHNTEGRIWTTKLTNDQGSFIMAKFQSFDHSRESYGAKYEYTQMEKVRRICPKKKRVGGKYLVDEYQSGYYSFGLSVKHKDMVLWGFAAPIFMGSRGFNDYEIMNPNFSPWQEELTPAGKLTTTYSGPVNVTFEISFTLNTNSISRSGISSLNLSSTDDHKVEISAEGVYYDETGQVCMVGCRNLKNASFDCEILVKFQFPRSRESLIKGNIESLREKNDPLYFEKLDIVSRSFSRYEAREWLRRMDLETVMVLISKTLTCVFTGRQLFHLKKRAEMVNSISLLMMLVLTLGHMVPLVLNFEAIFSNNKSQQNVPVRINGLLEVNEVIVRIVTMVAFILQFRLLQLTWIAKKNHWIHEIRTLVICLPMYIIGGSVMLLVNWKNGDDDDILSQLSIWGDLRSYAGLTIDGFLFPQLILNIFQISKGNALSNWFYIGTTFVRLMPHAYDLYRGQMYMSHQLDGLYVYANPRSDFYSPLWDIVIVCGGLVFAVIVFLQQLFGGRFMLPKRFQEHVEYEMVPVSNPDEPNKDAA
ncbi:hypothetical protein Hdeb2414_s0333g00870091 [Helianthus debilis subsp. tardiflorus]